MPSILDHPSKNSLNLLLIGPSKCAKTGSTLELANHGYRTVYADFDDKLANLAFAVVDKKNLEAGKVHYRTFRTSNESQAGPYQDFKKALKLWDDELGCLLDWGPDTVFVIDSLTALSKACFDNTKRLNPGSKDMRQIYGAAQDEMKNLLYRLTSSELKCHVIVICHLQYLDIYADQNDLPAQTLALPQTIGKALAPRIPEFFNSMLYANIDKKGNRVITTKPSRLIHASLPIIPGKEGVELEESYPVSEALPTIFKALERL